MESNHKQTHNYTSTKKPIFLSFVFPLSFRRHIYNLKSSSAKLFDNIKDLGEVLGGLGVILCLDELRLSRFIVETLAWLLSYLNDQNVSHCSVNKSFLKSFLFYISQFGSTSPI